MTLEIRFAFARQNRRVLKCVENCSTFAPGGKSQAAVAGRRMGVKRRSNVELKFIVLR